MHETVSRFTGSFAHIFFISFPCIPSACERFEEAPTDNKHHFAMLAEILQEGVLGESSVTGAFVVYVTLERSKCDVSGSCSS